MKRALSVLIIALLLVLPVFSAQADDAKHIYAIDGLFTDEELSSLETRVQEIAASRGVALYFFFDTTVEDLNAYIQAFANEHVKEENALVLGVNSDFYQFLKKGIAEDAFPEDVCKDTLWEAFRSVQNDPAGKVLAYLNAADQVLADYAASGHTASNAFEAPAYIALTDGGKPTLVDEADLLTESEEIALSNRLKEIGSRYQCDVVIVTVPGLGNKTVEEYADDYFDNNGYGYGATPDANGRTIDGDGVILLLSMEGGVGNRDCTVSTSGFATTAFTDYAIQAYLEPKFLPYFRNDNFARGFDVFADGCDELLKTARGGDPYDVIPRFSADEGIVTNEQRLMALARMDEIGAKHDVVVYYLYKPSATDLSAYIQKARSEGRFQDSDFLLFAANENDFVLKTYGAASSSFTEKDLKSIEETCLPLLRSGNVNESFNEYADLAEKILDRKPMNWFTLILSVFSGGALGFLPVSKMKRQLTDVTKQRNADSYLTPNSFLMQQNSDVLLRTNVSRSVHVVQSSSSGGGPRGGGGGGSFHGGSTTHTSSSGGTHGGHSSKF